MIQSPRMKSPKIFNDQPVKITRSDKSDGHMSFNKISIKETENNINQFINNLNWGIKHSAFMRITYGPDRNYDDIKSINQITNPTPVVSKDKGLLCDALITNQPGVALMLPTADCYPVTLFDPINKVLALAHMGWHSTTAQLLEKLITKMTESYNTLPNNLLVYFGPGIPAKYYKFPDPAQLKMSGWAEYLQKSGDEYEIDVLGYNLNQLAHSGVKKKNVEIDSSNTIDSPELESHYIHQKQNRPPAIRFLTAAMISRNS